MLATVYSTSLDRSCELVKASKKYLYWMQHDKDVLAKLQALGVDRPKISTDNERQFSVVSAGFGSEGVVNTVIGRPKSADSCRGDAPAAAFFDEVGFISADFWWSFAYPLLQVGGRVFTLATTPAPLDSFFDHFCKQIREENERGKFFFQLTNHSLVCDDCLEKDPQSCSHKLYLVPPWKSIARFESLRRMVPGKRVEEFSAEVFGILKRSTNQFFPAKIVEAVLGGGGGGATTQTLTQGQKNRGGGAGSAGGATAGHSFSESRSAVPGAVPVSGLGLAGLSPGEVGSVIYVAVDPASHQKSSMGLCAIAYCGPLSQASSSTPHHRSSGLSNGVVVSGSGDPAPNPYHDLGGLSSSSTPQHSAQATGLRFSQTQKVWVSGGPKFSESGGGSYNGQIALLGLAEVPMLSSDLLQCQMIVERFVFRLFAGISSGTALDLKNTHIVPIVECNNNDILALSLVRAIMSAAAQIGARSGNPFKRQYFQTGISDAIGVLTTESTK